MATILRAPALLMPFSRLGSIASAENPRALVSFSSSKRRLAMPLQLNSIPRLPAKNSLRFPTFVPVAASGETAETEEVEEVIEKSTEVLYSEKAIFLLWRPLLYKEDSDDEGAIENAVNGGDIADAEERVASVVQAALQSYKEALSNDVESVVAEIEGFLQSLEDEKNSLASKVALLSAELSSERERFLRISADFDNFRKRTERERLSLMTNVQGEVVESLLPVLDNFERAKASIKVETEGEQKINNSYQSIYKQFQEILTSLGVEAVETVGTAFDPLLHEAIMREESTEYEEGIIIQEFRKGFKLGERLLRPSMVKVSAGPGPAKSEEEAVPPADDGAPPADNEESGEGNQESDEDSDST